jgi:hypothetical protein
MAYVTHAEVQAAMSPQTFIGVFDDDLDGEADDVPIDEMIERASSRTDGWLAAIYNGPWPITQTPVPGLVRELTLQYVLAMAYERRPDFARQLGGDDKDRWARADELGKRLEAAVLRITDLEGQAKPANVGGVVVDNASRIIVDDPDGTSNSGDF